QARGARTVLQLLEQRWFQPAIALPERRLEALLVRIDVLIHERAEALQVVPGPGTEFEIHAVTPAVDARLRDTAQCACLWRTASYSSIPAATDTLRLSTTPSCGSLTRKSQVWRVRCLRPVPSAPSTSTTAPVRSTCCALLSPAASAPTIHRPACLSSLRVRTRLVTATTGVVSASPTATLRTVG